MVTCCCKHKCRLLEACWHCGELIPLFTSPFTVGNCPRCRQNLKLCATASVSDEGELEVASHDHDDIVFLLTPQPWEANSGSVIKQVGRRLSQVRQMKQRTAVEVASQIGVTLTVIEGIERGDFRGRGATLLCYFKYARYLCLSLKEAFNYTLDVPDHVSTTPLPLCPACQQSHYVPARGRGFRLKAVGKRIFYCIHKMGYFFVQSLLKWLSRTWRAQPLGRCIKKPMQNGIEGCFPQKIIHHALNRCALSYQAGSRSLLSLYC